MVNTGEEDREIVGKITVQMTEKMTRNQIYILFFISFSYQD